MVDEVESRQELLVGDMSQLAVDIIGLGMHGSWTAIGISRLGIGTLRLWDGDTVGVENLETQAYRPADVGRPKAEALAQVLRAFGFQGEIETRIVNYEPHSRERLHPIVICCADSMDTRKAVAQSALGHRARLFVESRSAANMLFLHAFKPTRPAVAHYLEHYFPTEVQQVACGATGTVSMGMQVASLVGSLLALTKGGEHSELIPGEHEMSLGLSHIAKPFSAPHRQQVR